jgi:hypothetical protein
MANPNPPITASTIVGPLDLTANIPSADNYGNSAMLSCSVQGKIVGVDTLTPGNNQWVVDNFIVGTTTLSFTVNYVPPTQGTNANITVSGTVLVKGQKPQDFSGMAFAWSSDGTLLIPASNLYL